MRKVINIVILLILVVSATLYGIKINSRDTVFAGVDSKYDESLISDLQGILGEQERLQSIKDRNNEINNNTGGGSSDGEDDDQYSSVLYTDFFELFAATSARTSAWKNLEVRSTGSLRADGSINGVSQSVSGIPKMLMQKNSSGHKYLRYQVLNLDLPYLGRVHGENKYFFAGSKYNISQWGERYSLTNVAFMNKYDYKIGDFFYDLTAENTNVDLFSYDANSQKYTARVHLKSSNGNAKGTEKYVKFLEGFCSNSVINDVRIVLPSVSLSFIIDKTCKFVSITTNEVWDGGLTWTEKTMGNIDVKLKIYLNFLQTYTYKTGYFETNKYYT